MPFLTAPSVLSASTRFHDTDPVEFGHRGPPSFPVHGIDAARFQGTMNWSRIRREGIKFAWVKATEGGDRLDPQFNANWLGATHAGIPIGAYHFYYFCTDPDTQAKWFIRNVPRLRGGMPPVLDLEWNPHSPTCTLRLPAREVRKVANRFIQIVERHYRTRVVVYTTPEFWLQNDVSRLKREFWLRSTAKHIEHKYGTSRWHFWQYTSTGVLDGVGTSIDLNCFNGSQSAWNSWLKKRAVG
jgi:lysozyme